MGNVNHPVLRRVRRPALLAAALVLTACPYGSEHPIGRPADAIADGALLGTWTATDEDGEALTATIRSAGTPGELAYVITAQNPEGGEPVSMPAFVSTIDGERFLNVREEAWFFLNYRVADGRLLLRLVDDALFESSSVASAADLEAFLRANLQDPRLYGEAGEPQWDWVLDRITGP